jgi:hypothetical protein
MSHLSFRQPPWSEDACLPGKSPDTLDDALEQGRIMNAEEYQDQAEELMRSASQDLSQREYAIVLAINANTNAVLSLAAATEAQTRVLDRHGAGSR